ncbi:MAG: hypothetical protein ACLS7P_09695, partial [Blautia sp.]
LLRCLDCLLPLLIELVDTFVLYTVCRKRNPVRSIFCDRVFIRVISLFRFFLYPHIQGYVSKVFFRGYPNIDD